LKSGIDILVSAHLKALKPKCDHRRLKAQLNEYNKKACNRGKQDSAKLRGVDKSGKQIPPTSSLSVTPATPVAPSRISIE